MFTPTSPRRRQRFGLNFTKTPTTTEPNMDFELDIDALGDDSLQDIPTDVLLTLLEGILAELVTRVERSENRKSVN
jgi:hypothetical protein